jgi:ABC-type phosphate/phosphonate transport system permease subunit
VEQGIALKTNKPKLIQTLSSRWIYKILAAFIAVVLIAGTVHAIMMKLSITAAFERHMGHMSENMQSMMGGSGMRGANLYASFLAAVNDSLLISALVAFAIVIPAAFFISHLITRPIQRLTLPATNRQG